MAFDVIGGKKKLGDRNLVFMVFRFEKSCFCLTGIGVTTKAVGTLRREPLAEITNLGPER